MRLKIGYFLGYYKILQWLGDGRFADVYLAQDSRPPYAQVALKVLKDEFVGDPKGGRSINVEWRVLHKVSGNRHVVRLVKEKSGTFGPDRRPFLILNLASGRHLIDWLDEREPFSEREGIPICLQACNALRMAHHKGIVHNDIKPEHFFWDGQGVTLIDWNVSHFVQGYGTWKQKLRHFLFRQKPNVEIYHPFRGDLLEFGVVMYALFTGWDARSLPYRKQKASDGPTQVSRIKHIVTGDEITWPVNFGEFTKTLSDRLRTIITRLLLPDAGLPHHLKADHLTRILSLDSLLRELQEHAKSLGLNPRQILRTRPQLPNQVWPAPPVFQPVGQVGPTPPAIQAQSPDPQRQVRALTAKGFSAMQAEDYEDAIDFFQQALKIDIHNETAHRFLQRSQSLLASRSPQSATSFVPVNRQVRALISKGTSAFNAGDYQAAIQFFEQAIDLDPENEKAVRLLTRARRAHLPTRESNRDRSTQISAVWERYLDPNTKGYYPAARRVLNLDVPYILEIIKGTHVGIWFPIQRGKRYSIGRDYQNTIVIPDSRVSQFHAALTVYPQGCGLEDLQSSNGSYINAKKIHKPRWLRARDEVLVGRTTLRLVSN